MSRRSLQTRIQNLLNQWRDAGSMGEAARIAAKAWVFLQKLKELPRESLDWEAIPTARDKTALPAEYPTVADKSIGLHPTAREPVFSTLRGQPYTPQPPAVHTHTTRPGFTLWDNDPEDEWDR